MKFSKIASTPGGEAEWSQLVGAFYVNAIVYRAKVPVVTGRGVGVLAVTGEQLI